MIKVVHIVNRLSFGGAEKLLLDLCRNIDKAVFDISVISLKKDGNDLLDKFLEAGIEVMVFDKKNKFDIKIIDRLVQYLNIIKPDIVHTHLFGPDFWGGMAARQAGIKNIVSTKHDILNEGFFRNKLGCQARHKATKVVAISDAIRDYLIKKEKIDYKKICVIYNGININKFYSDDNIFKTEDLIIGSVGRLSREKGYKHLIRACRFLKNKNWRLVLVGDGPIRKSLESEAKLLGIEEKIKFVGSHHDVRAYLDDFDVFVLPSLSEGLSLSILEAGANGKFVIATNVGGVPEIIDQNENGLLFSPKNIEELVNRLNWVDEHREQAQKMAKLLQEKVVEHFDLQRTIKQYERLYIDLSKKL